MLTQSWELGLEAFSDETQRYRVAFQLVEEDGEDVSVRTFADELMAINIIVFSCFLCSLGQTCAHKRGLCDRALGNILFPCPVRVHLLLQGW